MGRMQPTGEELATIPEGWTFEKYPFWEKFLHPYIGGRCCGKPRMMLKNTVMAACGIHVDKVIHRFWCPCCKTWLYPAGV